MWGVITFLPIWLFIHKIPFFLLFAELSSCRKRSPWHRLCSENGVSWHCLNRFFLIISFANAQWYLLIDNHFQEPPYWALYYGVISFPCWSDYNEAGVEDILKVLIVLIENELRQYNSAMRRLINQKKYLSFLLISISKYVISQSRPISLNSTISVS